MNCGSRGVLPRVREVKANPVLHRAAYHLIQGGYMRILIIGTILFLSACNGSTTVTNDSDLQNQINILNQEVASLKASIPPNQITNVSALQGKVSEIRLIGLPNKPQTIFEELGGTSLTPQFGPCANMGIQEGATTTGDALSIISKAFHTCTGYHVEYNTADGSVKTAPRLWWDGPNCTGNMWEFEAFGANYDTQTLTDGVVFSNPQDGTPLMVTSGQTPQEVNFQSIMVVGTAGCQSDIEKQLMYSVAPNSTTVTGAANSPIGRYTTISP